jgi:hypothetical protein
MMSIILNSLRRQRNVSRTQVTPPAALLQGSSTSLPTTLAHSYTPVCAAGSSPCIYKRGCPGPSQGRRQGREGEKTQRRLSQTAHLKGAPSLSLATLVTPTTSTPMQDNISLILPLVFHLASTHLGRDTQRQIHWSVEGPRGSKNVDKYGEDLSKSDDQIY